MAFIPKIEALRSKYLGEPSTAMATGAMATGAAPQGIASATGGAAPAGGSAAPPATGGGRFSAIRGFFEANQGTAEKQAEELAAPIIANAEKAKSKTDEAADTPENFGGLELSDEAIGAKDEALEGIDAATSPEGIAGLIGNRDATYTPGMRAADSNLYGRSEALQGLSKWEPVLSALNPTSRDALTKPEDIGARPTVLTPEQYAELQRRAITGPGGKFAQKGLMATYGQGYEAQRKAAAEWDEKDKQRQAQQAEWDEWSKKAGG